MLVAAILAVLTLTMLAASVTNGIGHARRRAEASALLRSIEGLSARLERLEAAANVPKVPPAIPPEPVAIATTPPRRDRAVRTPFSGPTLISVPDLSRSAREAAPHIPDPALSERFKAVWDLSRAGETPEAIARATGHPVGQVELILGLRRRRPTAPRGGPRSR